MQSRGRFVTGGFKKNGGLLNLSVSKAKTFDDCRLKFRFSYIEKLPKKDWEHFVFGNLLHSTLERFHKDIIAKNSSPYNILMSTAFKGAIEEFKEKATKEQKDEAWDILNIYLNNLPNDKFMGSTPNVLDVERNFFINIDNRILLNGFIDRIQLDTDGLTHVADYKTSKKKDFLKKDKFQLLTYAYVLFLDNPALEKVRTSYILLRHDCEYMEQEFTREEAMMVEDKLLKYADDIESEKLYRASPTPLCRYCDYMDNCTDGKRFIDIMDSKKDEKDKKHGLMSWG